MSPRTSSNFLPRSPASVALTAAQRAAITRKANREAQRLRDEALVTESLNRGERGAMTKAKEKKVWMDENSKKRRRKDSEIEHPPVVIKQTRKRAKVLLSSAPKYDDVEDDIPASGVLLPRSKRATTARGLAMNSEKKGEESAAQPHGDQGRTRESQDRVGLAAHVVGPSDPDNDNEPGYATDRDQEDPRAHDSGSELDIDPEPEEDEYDETAYDQPRWTPVRDLDEPEDELVCSQQVDDTQTVCDSDPEPEYVRAHGLTALTRLKSYADVSQLFETDEGVTDARATGSKVSKREQKRRSEEATWQGPNAIKANPAKSANEQARGARVSGGQQAQKAVPLPSESAQPTHPSQRNASTTAWSALTAIAVTSHGNLALNQSSADVRKVFHRAEEEMKLSVVTQNAYEDIDARSKIRFLTNTLARAAWNLECPEIDNRLREDSGYARVLVEALSTRMSQFRGRFRTSAAARVAAYFGLNNGSGDLARRVEDLLAKKRYIYPVGLSENAARARPYENNILTEVVQDVLITRNRDFIKDNVDMFKVNWQGDKFLELPVPVIALSATAVHAALLNYRASKGSQSTEFSADQYSAIYDTHVTVLRAIQEQRPGAYHRLLKKLFEDVVGSSTSVTTRADANEVLEDLDFDNLDADVLNA